MSNLIQRYPKEAIYTVAVQTGIFSISATEQMSDVGLLQFDLTNLPPVVITILASDPIFQADRFTINHCSPSQTGFCVFDADVGATNLAYVQRISNTVVRLFPYNIATDSSGDFGTSTMLLHFRFW